MVDDTVSGAVPIASVDVMVPVVVVFLSGRPLFTGQLINLVDAFVAAWLPGSQGEGVADVLVAEAGGKPRRGFTGRLAFAWPADGFDTIAGVEFTITNPKLSPALYELMIGGGIINDGTTPDGVYLVQVQSVAARPVRYAASSIRPVPVLRKSELCR